ncbi:hypothetical protein B5S31_g1732 [[Candida] boidinii]|nr:hypothetical protein B5S31_g1732 [[Candida] boidinii]
MSFINSQSEEKILPMHSKSNSLKIHDDTFQEISHSNPNSPRNIDYIHQGSNSINNNLTPSTSSASRLTPLSQKQNKNSLYNNKTKQDSLPKTDRPRFILLIILYLLQGVPIGLAFGSIPFLLKSSDLSYSDLGIFSLASYPYSLKLLWSPIVDSFFFKKVGRRRSWIIPVQTVSGLTLLFLGSTIDVVMTEVQSNLYRLTYTFFLLILLCATQDIAVDGWALTILSKDALSFASTAQTIGLNTGYFLSFTVFLAMNSPDFANSYIRKVPIDAGFWTLGQYLTFWGWCYLVVTVLVAVLVPEDPPFSSTEGSDKKFDENINSIPLVELERDLNTVNNPLHSHNPVIGGGDQSDHIDSGWKALVSVYSKMWKVLQLSNVKLFVIIHLISKFAFQVNESATNLKLLDKGFSKEDLAITVLIDFPFEIIFGYYAGTWSNGDEPLKPWLYAFLGRLLAAGLGQILVWGFPESGKISTSYFLCVILQHLLGSFMSTVQFVSICAFHTKIADPLIGGTYMTTLNTLSNLGGTWPKLIILYLIDNFTIANCIPEGDDEFDISKITLNNPFVKEPFYNCISTQNKTLCKSSGGTCHVSRDGYFSTNLLCITIGLFLYFGWIRRTMNYLQSLPITAWRIGKSYLPI